MAKFYKHKTIERFRVGRFEFKKHICRVEDEDVEDFETEYDGLHGIDQVNITEVLNIENERPVGAKGPKVIRGSASSMNTTAGLDGAAKQAQLVSQEEALREKEADLLRREAELDKKLRALEAGNSEAAPESKVESESESDSEAKSAETDTATEPKPATKLGIGGIKLGPQA